MKDSGLVLVMIFLVASLMGCSVAPSDVTVSQAVGTYFENAHYRVIALKIGSIEGLPLSEKTYMGSPGYVVDLASVILEPQMNKGADIKKGEQLAFSNVRLRLVQDNADRNLWHVFIVSGLSLP